MKISGKSRTKVGNIKNSTCIKTESDTIVKILTFLCGASFLNMHFCYPK